MMLPRSFHRTAQRWVVNATTLAALMGSVWMSAHERLLPMRDDATTPAAAGTPAAQPDAQPAVDSRDIVATGAHAATLSAADLGANAVHRVAFSAGTSH